MTRELSLEQRHKESVMSPEKNLSPCPFCGGAASIVKDGGNEIWGQSWHVGCTKCSVQFKEIGSNSWDPNEKYDAAAELKAVSRWNTRAKTVTTIDSVMPVLAVRPL